MDVRAAPPVRVRTTLQLLRAGDERARHEPVPPAVPPPRAVDQLECGEARDASGEACAGVPTCGEAGAVIGCHGRLPSGPPRGGASAPIRCGPPLLMRASR